MKLLKYRNYLTCFRGCLRVLWCPSFFAKSCGENGFSTSYHQKVDPAWPSPVSAVENVPCFCAMAGSKVLPRPESWSLCNSVFPGAKVLTSVTHNKYDLQNLGEIGHQWSRRKSLLPSTEHEKSGIAWILCTQVTGSRNFALYKRLEFPRKTTTSI